MRQEDFDRVIYKCLKVIDYQGSNDNQKLKAAIDDLAGDYPDEKRFLNFFGDDKFFSMCSKSMAADYDQIPFIVKETVKYLCNEKFAEREISERVSGEVTEAFWRWGHPGEPFAQAAIRQSDGFNETELLPQDITDEVESAYVPVDQSIPQGRAVRPGKSRNRIAVFIISASIFLAAVIFVIAIESHDWNDNDDYYDSWWYDYYSDQPVDKVTKWNEPGPENADLVAAYGENILSTDDAIKLVEEHFYGDTLLHKGTRDSRIQFNCTDTSDGDYAIDVSYEGNVIWPTVVTDDGRIYCKRDGRMFGNEIPTL